MKKTLSACALTLALSLSAWCQATAGRGAISGSVTDPSGSAVAGAKVVVSNPALGLNRELTTTGAGVFSAPALVPGPGYKVLVEKQGFSVYSGDGITVQVGQVVDLKVALAVGAMTQKIDVNDAAPLVDDVKTENSTVVTGEQIDNLPINGRRVDSFVLLTPAVTKDGDFGLLTFRGMAGGNAFVVDGVDTTNQYYNENAGRTRLGSQLSQDAVQEFQVLNSSYAAEFGGAVGGVVNTVTKSGTNNLHGTFFWYFRNRTLDARDRYALINPQDVRHQTGGTLGGALIKNKLFAFFNSEVQRRHNPISSSILNANVNGSTQSWIGCAAPATTAQCSAANSVLPRMFGLVDRRADQELYFLKLDYHLNDRNTFSASMNYLHWFSVNGIQTASALTNGSALGSNGDDSVRDRIGKLGWTFVPVSSVVNEFKFGWFKDRQADDFNPTLLKGYPIGVVGLSVAGVSNLGGYNILPRVLPSENRYQFADSLSWVKGAHTMKFGADLSRTQDFSNSLSTRFGSYNYANVTNFALDFSSPKAGSPSNYSSFTQVFGNPIVDTTITSYALFAQDSWKVNSRLTANYGLRYEYSVLPQPTTTNPYYSQTGHIASAKNNYAPRVGFAYRINDKTVIRAGFGLYYARYQSGLISTFFTANDVYTQSLTVSSPTVAGAPIFPNTLPSATGVLASNRSITFAAPNMRNPYSEQLNIALERAVTKTLSLTASYVMNRGKRLYTVRDINIGPLSSQTYNFTILDTNYQPTGQVYSTPIYLLANRLDTRYGHINQVENGGKQWYDALVLQANKRFSKTFQGSIAYTWSHELDLNQLSGSSAIFFSSGPAGLYNGAYSYDKGNGNLDQRHRFVGTFVARPTFTKSESKFARNVINGWEWTGLLNLSSGRPAFESVTFSSTANLPQAFTGTLNGLGGDTRVPFLQNNPLRLDPTTRFDTRIQKKIELREKMSLTLLFEVFNLTNTVSNTSVLSQGYSAANKGTAAAPNFVITPCTSATATSCTALTPGLGTASAGFPDGTNARRAQVGMRFAF